jgi:fused signal recognition particle receptor
MWGFFKKDKAGKDQAKQAETPAEQPVEQAPEVEPPQAAEPEQAAPAAEQPAMEERAQPQVPEAEPESTQQKTWFARLREGLSRTRNDMTDGLASLFLGKKQLDDELLEELETRLLMADVGVDATGRIIRGVTERVARRQLTDTQALFEALRDNMAAILKPVSQPLVIDNSRKPFVILVVGVNGAGKTTTIGKLARRFKDQGHSVMLAAGDTFRAAAVEQLQAWGERSRIPVVAQHAGADSASVIFDALQAAKARGADVLIADTAGRLHTQSNLMEELKKVKRVLGKLDPEAPHETLLVLDASTGQNALNQAKKFHEAIALDGVVLTKLDGTAKGGVIFAIADALKLPIRFVGVGESVEDLRPFDAQEFVAALLDQPAER